MCAAGSISLRVMNPLRSRSRASQAPATSAACFVALAASWNSCQLQLLELSLSRTMRQARRKCPYFASRCCLNSSAAASFGVAVSHAGGLQASKMAKSPSCRYFLPCQSSQAASVLGFLLKPLASHALWNSAYVSLCRPPRSSAAKMSSEDLAPRFSAAHSLNCASSCAQYGSNSSSVVRPLPSWSSALQRERTSPCQLSWRQTFTSSARCRVMVPSWSRALRHARKRRPNCFLRKTLKLFSASRRACFVCALMSDILLAFFLAVSFCLCRMTSISTHLRALGGMALSPSRSMALKKMTSQPWSQPQARTPSENSDMLRSSPGATSASSPGMLV
mmetsp:Transcript_13920/g.39623  ORF Transcript_13920/g.39623 Transcript_13920/m.39623 type:complete len:334 (-) Transcript_13920:477-1478(-)